MTTPIGRRAAVRRRPEPVGGPPAVGDRASRVRVRLANALVALTYLALALVVFGPLWMDLGRGYLTNSMQDQYMWEWFFAATAHAVVNLDNPLFSVLQNQPDGVNMMANTAMLGLGIPLTPLTLAFGPSFTWALALTGGLAVSAYCWYWLLARRVVGSRLAAAIGGAWCGFAPAIISHANAHPNFVVLFVLPLIVDRVIAMAEGRRPVRDGVLAGLLMAWQVLIGEEALLIGATTFGVFAVTYAASRPRAVAGMLRPLATGGGIAAAVCFVLVAFPLWYQFFGPQSYGSLEHGPRGNDLAAFSTFATESLAGGQDAAAEWSMNRTEENAFFGWPLLVLLAGLVVWLWRDRLVRALAIAAVALAWISTGLLLTVGGAVTTVPGPWLLLADLPLFESVLESRFALGCVPLIGALLALGTVRAMRIARTVPDWRVAAPVIWTAVLVTALLPVAPTPLEVHKRDPVPAFFADGTWRDYVAPGGAVVTVPVADAGHAEPLWWQISADLRFPLAGGYFVGPSKVEGYGRYGPVARDTAELLEDVAESGVVPEIDEDDRVAALADLRHWNADVLVLTQREHARALWDTVNLLLAKPGHKVGDVWVWNVRAITS